MCVAIIGSTISLVIQWPHHSFGLTTLEAAAARSGRPGLLSGRREVALSWTTVSPMARSRCFGSIAIVVVSLVASVIEPGCRADAQTLKTALHSTDVVFADPFAELTAEASRRFGIPERWIRAVMRVESAGEARAISKTGAIGLMQIMPGTWADLRARYGLGDDPFLPRDNILAGTAYLRELYDRFGAPGFLAAYNAGPARYDDHLTTGRPLPEETRTYVAMLAPLTGVTPTDSAASVMKHVISWRQAPLFVVQEFDKFSNARPAAALHSDRSSNSPFVVSRAAFKAQVVGLFVTRSTGGQSR